MHDVKRGRPRVPGQPNPVLATKGKARPKTEPNPVLATKGKARPKTEGGRRAEQMMVVPGNMSQLKATSEAAKQLGRGA